MQQQFKCPKISQELPHVYEHVLILQKKTFYQKTKRKMWPGN